MPNWRLGAAGSERARHRPQSANWAYDVHTLRPVTRYPPSTGTALVASEARSLPASGSLKSWHHSSVGRQDAGEEPSPLFLGPVGHQGRTDQVDADPADQFGRPGPGQLLDDDVVLERAQAASARPRWARSPPPIGRRPGRPASAGRRPRSRPGRRSAGAIPRRRATAGVAATRSEIASGGSLAPPWCADSCGAKHGTGVALGDTRVRERLRLPPRGLRPLSRSGGLARRGRRPPRSIRRSRCTAGQGRRRRGRRHAARDRLPGRAVTTTTARPAASTGPPGPPWPIRAGWPSNCPRAKAASTWGWSRSPCCASRSDDAWWRRPSCPPSWLWGR